MTELIQERFKSLPTVTAPTRDNTVVTIPLGNYQMDIATHQGLMASTMLYSGEFTHCGQSHVGMARELLFNTVLDSPFEWMVCIDADIGFHLRDMEKLLTLEHDRDYAVNGVYAKKQESEEAVIQGLGFARIHRCVLEAIATHCPLKFDHEGRERQQFCLQGVTGNRRMMCEDVGFWYLCSLVGVKPRLLYDLHLKHFGGRRGYQLSDEMRLFPNLNR